MRKLLALFVIMLLSLVGSTAFSQTVKEGNIDTIVKFDVDSVLHFKVKAGDRTTIKIKKVSFIPKTGMSKFLSGFKLAKTFQVAKDKEDAAFVNLVYPKDTTGSQNFGFALAYAITFNKINQLKPFIEWQRNNLSDKEQNLFLSGLTFQTNFWDIPVHPVWNPILIATANYKHDNVKNTEGIQTSIYLTPNFNNIRKMSFLPGAYNSNPVLGFYYDIYVGAEFEDRSRVKVESEKGSVGRWYGRATATFFPLPDILDQRLEVVPDYIYRFAFHNKSTAETKVNKMWKLSANLVIIKKTAGFAEVKIGYDHTHGSDPTAGFDKQELGTFTLKVKI